MDAPTDRDLRQKFQDCLTIPLWPDWGAIMGFSRNFTYEAAQKGQIEGAFRTGRLWRIPTAVVRRQLKLEPVAAVPVPDHASKAAA